MPMPPHTFREYMREYRRGKKRDNGAWSLENPIRREELKMATRLYTFKWRLSKILGPQYEILVYAQSGPNNGVIGAYTAEACNDEKAVRAIFPLLQEFKNSCDIGGGELFKAFVLLKFTRKFMQVTECVVGVLDKAILLESLQQLPNQGGERWEQVWDKVRIQARKEEWKNLDFSKESDVWLKDRGGKYRTLCQRLKWTARKEPKWNSQKLHRLLHGWTLGTYRRGPAQHYENPTATSELVRKAMFSPIL